MDALFGPPLRMYGVNSPEFVFQFAPSWPMACAYSEVITLAPLHAGGMA
jgi:hypothetical protein